MKNYLVTWEIEIEADTPRKAAEEALRIQRDSESMAKVFKVYADDEKFGPEMVTVDLEEQDNGMDS